MIKNLALLAILLISLAGCRLGSRAEELAALLRIAPVLLQAAPPSGPLPPEQWPPALKSLNPKSVYSRPEGIYIVTFSFFVEEEGLFLPRSPAFAPVPGGDPEYTRIVQGLYSYRLQG
ncbi:hypothetical protein QLQ15_06470 [Lysobacter sp. LF1]|uniref:Lipoprotein n=1 Tax=Lysobacter stagni TaxID=3045172 RepID=A0ABT6XEI8_9GAMM|nr:hypothetical protein [Lysobacter sp. LF1]MDI9238557.1 hypothetical protein [Lysobacter sp. LF1]